MKEREPGRALETMRERWRAARAAKLSRKDELLAGGGDGAAVRRDRAYRTERKTQRRYAVMMRHVERRMNRKRAREKSEE